MDGTLPEQFHIFSSYNAYRHCLIFMDMYVINLFIWVSCRFQHIVYIRRWQVVLRAEEISIVDDHYVDMLIKSIGPH